MQMQTYQISAEDFRRRLACMEAPEARFDERELDEMKERGVEMILALREVFGSGLDRKTLWERMANGMAISAAKSGGKCDKFIAAMIDYVKAEANQVVGSDSLKSAARAICAGSPEWQRQFIRMCVEYRMLLCLGARERAQDDKLLREQTGAKSVEVLENGTIMARGVGQ